MVLCCDQGLKIFVPDRMSGVLKLVYVCTVDLCHSGVGNLLSPGNVELCASRDWEILIGNNVKDKSCWPHVCTDHDSVEKVTNYWR